jgi:hypothetical protein
VHSIYSILVNKRTRCPIAGRQEDAPSGPFRANRPQQNIHHHAGQCGIAEPDQKRTKAAQVAEKSEHRRHPRPSRHTVTGPHPAAARVRHTRPKVRNCPAATPPTSRHVAHRLSAWPAPAANSAAATTNIPATRRSTSPHIAIASPPVILSELKFASRLLGPLPAARRKAFAPSPRSAPGRKEWTAGRATPAASARGRSSSDHSRAAPSRRTPRSRGARPRPAGRAERGKAMDRRGRGS